MGVTPAMDLYAYRFCLLGFTQREHIASVNAFTQYPTDRLPKHYAGIILHLLFRAYTNLRASTAILARPYYIASGRNWPDLSRTGAVKL